MQLAYKENSEFKPAVFFLKIVSHPSGWVDIVSKVGDHSRGWPEGSLFNSYYTEM